MHKKIGTKHYDTERSVAVLEGGGTALYRKRRGEYFLYHQGSEEIQPVSYDEARGFVCRVVGPDSVDSVMSPGKNDGRRAVLCASVPRSIIACMRTCAERRGVPVSAWLCEAVAAYAEADA